MIETTAADIHMSAAAHIHMGTAADIHIAAAAHIHMGTAAIHSIGQIQYKGKVNLL